jgi:hypothetical protein
MSSRGKAYGYPGSSLDVICIYKNPSDFPGKFVARRQWLVNGEIKFDPIPILVSASLEEVRQNIPGHMVHMARHPQDDPAIYEVWI